MEQKIIFFDIDGTLMERSGQLSDSTHEALLKAQENGHKLCLATGRSRGNLPSAVKVIPWDGYVLGSGIYGEYQQQVVLDEEIATEQVLKVIDYVDTVPKLELALENNDSIFLTKAGQELFLNKLKASGHFDSPEALKTMLAELTMVSDLREVSRVNKMMYFSEGAGVDSLVAEFKESFDFLPNSVVMGNDLRDGEILKKGISKAVGIARVIEKAGFQQNDVIAFGDGYNDIEMIQYAGIGVAMGEGVEDLKQVADLVTGTQAEGGISQAMAKLQLI